MISGFITFGLLMFLCKALNDLVYHFVHKHRAKNGIYWMLAHEPWVRWSVGGAVGFLVAFIVMTEFLNASAPRNYVVPEPTVVTKPINNAVFCYSNMENVTLQDNVIEQDKAEARKWAAYAIWYEARGEGPQGRLAVASVLWNRSGGEPGNILGVLQNTNWLGRPDLLDPSKADPECPIYQESKVLAQDLIAGTFRPIGRWTHFYAPAKADPPWKWQLKGKKQIGNHVFGVLPQ